MLVVRHDAKTQRGLVRVGLWQDVEKVKGAPPSPCACATAPNSALDREPRPCRRSREPAGEYPLNGLDGRDGPPLRPPAARRPDRDDDCARTAAGSIGSTGARRSPLPTHAASGSRSPSDAREFDRVGRPSNRLGRGVGYLFSFAASPPPVAFLGFAAGRPAPASRTAANRDDDCANGRRVDRVDRRGGARRVPTHARHGSRSPKRRSRVHR